jgi:AcrR family transcriptional regulator
MVHVGKDKRQIQSAKLICQGLDTLMTRREYRHISVTQIAEEAGVGRATFYRLFDDKSDVVAYQMELVFEEMLINMSPDTQANVVLSALFESWLKRKDLFLSLIHAGLYEDFQTRLALVLEQRLSFIRKINHIDDKTWHYFVQVRAAMLFSALRVAISTYPEDGAADIIASLESLFGNKPRVLELPKNER